MFEKEDNMGNIKAASTFMLSLKKTAANVGHFGVLFHFICSTMAIVIASESSKQLLITL